MRLLWLTAPSPISNTSQLTWRERGQNCSKLTLSGEMQLVQTFQGHLRMLSGHHANWQKDRV
jgi:hypothetical protein